MATAPKTAAQLAACWAAVKIGTSGPGCLGGAWGGPTGTVDNIAQDRGSSPRGSAPYPTTTTTTNL